MKNGLKGVPGGRNELRVVPQVDLDIVNSVLKVLEGWELGNSGLHRKYWSYNKSCGSPKNRFLRYFWIFPRKNSGKIKKSFFRTPGTKIKFRFFYDFLYGPVFPIKTLIS